MKRAIILACVFAAMCSSGWSQVVKSKSYDMMLGTLLDHSVDEVSVHEIGADTANIIFLDARERGEFEVSHIRGAHWIGYDDFDISRLPTMDSTTRIIVYCSVGYRSEKISETLDSAGYSGVSNLYGGIFEWVNQGKEVVSPENTPTDTVHAYDRIWGIWLSNGNKVYK